MKQPKTSTQMAEMEYAESILQVAADKLRVAGEPSLSLKLSALSRQIEIVRQTEKARAVRA